MGRVRAYIGLGSNVGDPTATLAGAVCALGGLAGVRIRGVSRLYATTPVGVTDQPEFRNAVVVLDVRVRPDAGAARTPNAVGPDVRATAAIALLVQLKGVERAFGRRRRQRWGPRELDLDILVFGRAWLSLARPPAGRSLDADFDPGRAARLLEVPHRDARTRLFVLAPLADLAPRLVPPGWGETVESARRRQVAIEGPASVRAVGEWDPVHNGWR